jgi:hypothetical protein
MKKDLTDDEIRTMAMEIEGLLKPFRERYGMKYVLSAAVEKPSDPNVARHFILASEEHDPMWSVIAIARAGQHLHPMAERQRAAMDLMDKVTGAKP